MARAATVDLVLRPRGPPSGLCSEGCRTHVLFYVVAMVAADKSGAVSILLHAAVRAHGLWVYRDAARVAARALGVRVRGHRVFRLFLSGPGGNEYSEFFIPPRGLCFADSFNRPGRISTRK